MINGIVKCQVEDENQNILSERLLFAKYDQQLNIEISTDKEIYDLREKVEVKLKTTNEAGVGIPSNLSVGVVDNTLVSFADDKQDDLCSYLLMSSELKGKIHEPSFYFDKSEPKATRGLDLVMLTHGWRSYLTQPIKEVKNFPGVSKSIKGTVVNLQGAKVPAKLWLLSQETKNVITSHTDSIGDFEFELASGASYDLIALAEDKTAVMIQLRDNDEGGKQNIYNPYLLKGKVDKPRGTFNPKNKVTRESIDVALDLDNNPVMMTADDKSLNEVVVIGYGSAKKFDLTGNVVSVSSSEIDHNNWEAVQGKLAGLNINSEGGSDTEHRIQIRGSASLSSSSEPLIIIDGVPVESTGGNQSILSTITPSDVSEIHVVSPSASSAAIYGSRGANGVILLNTNSGYYRYSGWRSLGLKKKISLFFTSY